MQNLAPNFITSLQATREIGIAPVYFFYVEAKNRSTGAIEPFGLWTGDDDIPQNVQTPTGGLVTRPYYGGTNLSVADIKQVADLTDEPVTISMSQIADATQQLVRGYDVRRCYCEVHVTSWVGGNFSSVPQLEFIGIIDDGDLANPPVDGEGSISLVARSELMTQLLAPNPAKSSDSHQKRRQANDRFSEYSGTVQARKVQWRRD